MKTKTPAPVRSTVGARTFQTNFAKPDNIYLNPDCRPFFPTEDDPAKAEWADKMAEGYRQFEEHYSNGTVEVSIHRLPTDPSSDPRYADLSLEECIDYLESTEC